MNDDIEQRLARLQPAPEPEEVRARLLAIPGRRGKIVRWIFAGAAPLAAAAAWLFLPRAPEALPTPENGPARYRVMLPVERSSTLVGVEELGVIEPVPAQPVRLMRAVWLDEITYRGDDGRSTMRRSQPRAEIIPVRLHTL